MVFSSIPFLYYFLPAVLTVYFLVPSGWRNAVLLLSSLFFYGWGEPRLLWLMVFTIVLFYGCGLAIEKAKSRKGKKLWLAVSAVISIGFLAVFKYADFVIGSFNAVTGLSLPLLKLALPVGISFYSFQCLSYTIDVYRGNVPAQKNPISFGAYVALFPQLIAVPIVRYTDIARELGNRAHSWENVAYGLRRFLTGLNGIAAALGLAVDDFVVGKNGTQCFAPVDGHLDALGIACFPQLLEDPLGPLVELRIGSSQHLGPVVVKAQFLQLAGECINVLLGKAVGVVAGIHSVLLCGQAEGVIAHGVQNIEALHTLHTGHDVGSGIAFGVTCVQTHTARVLIAALKGQEEADRIAKQIVIR